MLSLTISGVRADIAPLKTAMKSHFTSISDYFRDMYAPTSWKKEFSGWSLLEEKERVYSIIDEKEDITVKDYQFILRDFFHSTKDYHVGFSFYSTEKASLPLTIRGAEGRYFIAYIDRIKLSLESFPFEVGDEVISFAGMPINEKISEIKTEIDKNVSQTDQALAEYTLTRRRASRGITVPKGPVSLEIKRFGEDKTVEHQLVWDYTEEKVNYSVVENVFKRGGLHPNTAFNNFTFEDRSLKNKLESTNMISYDVVDDAKAFEQLDNPHQIGGKNSFIPKLGTPIWEADRENSFSAYIYQNEDKKLIGYLRIPSYSADEKESKEFEEIIKKFEQTTDALVIDQVNNPGGSVFYLYSLVSMLTDKAVSTPKHKMTVLPNDVLDAKMNLPALRNVSSDEEAKKVLGTDTVGGYPVSVTFVKFMIAYYEFLINEFEEGRILTRPYHIWGVDKINPHPEVNYSKPILLLVNELDFSGGDFFPATLQDNKMVKILGTRTAGAGGYVLSFESPNMFGVERFSLTGSIAERVDGNPIENLGVTPDVEYSLTANDFQNNFEDYVNKIKEEIAKMF